MTDTQRPNGTSMFQQSDSIAFSCPSCSCFPSSHRLWSDLYLRIHPCIRELRCRTSHSHRLFNKPIQQNATRTSLYSEESSINTNYSKSVTTTLLQSRVRDHPSAVKVSTRLTMTSIALNLPLSNSTTTIKSAPLAPSTHSPTTSSHPHRIQPQATFKPLRHGLLRQYPKHHLLPQNLAPNRRRAPPLLPKRRRHLRLRIPHRRNHPRHAQGSRSHTAVPGHRKKRF